MTRGHGPYRLSETEMFARLQAEANERAANADRVTAIRPADLMLFDLLPDGSGLTRQEAIDQHKCVSCTTPGPVDFRDRQSVREYNLTGMCQECQDDFYNESAADNGHI